MDWTDQIAHEIATGLADDLKAACPDDPAMAKVALYICRTWAESRRPTLTPMGSPARAGQERTTPGEIPKGPDQRIADRASWNTCRHLLHRWPGRPCAPRGEKFLNPSNADRWMAEHAQAYGFVPRQRVPT